MACWSRSRRGALLLLALFALAGMLGRGFAPMAVAKGGADQAIIAALGGTLCHDTSDNSGAPEQPAKPGHMDCALCPACVPLGSAVLLPEPARVAFTPAHLPRMAWASPARPRAPPAVALIAASPRGPPALI